MKVLKEDNLLSYTCKLTDNICGLHTSLETVLFANTIQQFHSAHITQGPQPRQDKTIFLAECV